MPDGAVVPEGAGVGSTVGDSVVAADWVAVAAVVIELAGGA
jgi:hypothetical protein